MPDMKCNKQQYVATLIDQFVTHLQRGLRQPHALGDSASELIPDLLLGPFMLRVDIMPD